jgi:hypothetical protein
MTRAFVLGNGVSRLAVNLHQVKEFGPIYGCNALYREFLPSVLISTDKPIATRIQEEGIASQLRMYTRKPTPGLGAMRIPNDWYGFSSGPVATAIAAHDGNTAIYMLGFDLGPLPGEKFNNIYADTEFYKKSSARPTFSGNWVRQIQQITKTFPKTNFFRVMGNTTAEIADLRKIPNMVHMPMTEFLDRINNTKDL